MMQEEINKVKIVMMKSGVPLIVKEETGRKIEASVQNQEKHSFIKITELDITINTAEVAAIYNQEQYAKALKVKAGEWVCEHFEWHTKGEKCECKKKAFEKARKIQEQKDEEEYNTVLTPEQREKNRKRMAEIRESFKGIGPIGKLPTTRNK